MDSDICPNAEDIDIFTLTPMIALRMLCSTIENLVRITGDIPPTPPISQLSTPTLGLVQVEKENVSPHGKKPRRRQSGYADITGDIDGVPARAKTPIGSPEAGPSDPLHIVATNMVPLDSQHGAIIRKFSSKKPPAISLEEYLKRLHQYCPMSTAVYLATSLYIFRLALVERIISVTSRNIHRLVLAGLRVAMKALEDFSYPHRRYAKVGGVSEIELGRLEISFCFVTNFELRVDKEGLLEHAKSIRNRELLFGVEVNFQPQLPDKCARDVVVEQSKPRTAMAETSVAE